MNDPIRVAVITAMIPAYRRDYFRRIFAQKDLEVTVFCQDAIPGMNIPSVHREFVERIVEVSYLGLGRERAGWQKLPLARLLKGFDVYFVYGNPRLLSNVMIATLLRVMGKKVIIAGQLHTAGKGGITEEIRLAWWRLFRYIYLYTDTEVDLLKRRNGFAGKIMIGMNNGLDQDTIDTARRSWSSQHLERWRDEQNLAGRTVILSCARLEAKNRFDWMIECLPALIERQQDLLWCVIGDGPELARLQAKASGLGVNTAIRWLGTLYDEKELAPWFLNATVLVHPGAIGLSLLHSFGYGLPVVTHDDAVEQMPEFAALQPGKNGAVYRYGDLASLQETVLNALEAAPGWRDHAKTTTEAYNTKVMAQRFHEMTMLAFRG